MKQYYRILCQQNSRRMTQCLLPEVTHLIRHERANGPADLAVPDNVSHGPKKEEDEAGGHRDLCEVTQHLGTLEPYKGNDGVGEEVDLTNEDVRCLRTVWDLLEEVLVVHL